MIRTAGCGCATEASDPQPATRGAQRPHDLQQHQADITPLQPPPFTLPRCSDLSVWRAAHTSAAAGRANSLLASRGRRQLGLRLPTGRTNLTATDELEFVGVRQGSPAAQLQQARQQAQLTAHGDHQQRQAVRLQPRHPPQPGPAKLPAAPALEQQQLQQPSMSLLTSLQYHEQCHRQQLAAAWGSTAFVAAAEAHLPASLHSKEQGLWDAQQQLAAVLQQQAVAAATAAAGWPYGIPQQQGGWAFASRLAPQRNCPGILPGHVSAALAAC